VRACPPGDMADFYGIIKTKAVYEYVIREVIRFLPIFA